MRYVAIYDLATVEIRARVIISWDIDVERCDNYVELTQEEYEAGIEITHKVNLRTKRIEKRSVNSAT